MIFTKSVNTSGNVNDLVCFFFNLRALVTECITNKDKLKLVETTQKTRCVKNATLFTKDNKLAYAEHHLELGLDKKAKIIQQMKNITLGVDSYISALFNLRADKWYYNKIELERSLPLRDALSILVDRKLISCDISILIESTNEYIKSMKDKIVKFKSVFLEPKILVTNGKVNAILNEDKKRLKAIKILSEQVNKLEAYFSTQNVLIKFTDLETTFKDIKIQISILENSVTPMSQYNCVTPMIQRKGTETRTPRVYS